MTSTVSHSPQYHHLNGLLLLHCPPGTLLSASSPPCIPLSINSSLVFSQPSKPCHVWNNHASATSIVSSNNTLRKEWAFSSGSSGKIMLPKTKLHGCLSPQRKPLITASLGGSAQLASNIFTLGTVLVLPFYTLMVFAPHSKLTKKSMESNIPYIALGALYTYLLGMSWTSETLRLMFASKYWLPELPGITKMFSSDLTVASAWLHLLAVDLFAARQIFQDGLKDGIETRHSIIFCLLFCPIGIMSHFITKVITHLWRRSKRSREAAETVL